MLDFSGLHRVGLALLGTAVTSFAACGGSSSHDAPGVDGGPIPDGGSPDSAPALAAKISVAGHVVTSDANATPIAGRNVAILDAADALFNLTTDASGAFHADGVVPPYEALVVDANVATEPTVYIGLSTPRPRLGADAPSSSSCTPLTAMVEVPLALPQCGSSECRYTATIASADGSVSGSSIALYDPAQPPAEVVPTAAWCTASTTVDVVVSVFVSDALNNHYFYVQSPATTVTAAATTSVAMLTPLPVAATATLTATAAELQAGWSNAFSASLVFTNPSATIPFFSGVGMTDSFLVPDIPGATLSLSATATYEQTASTASDSAVGIPLATTSYPLTLPPAPMFTTAVTQNMLSGTSTITWTEAATHRLYEFSMWTQGDSLEEVGLVFLKTSGNAIDLGRLTRMGVQLQSGAVGMLLSDVGGAPSLDALVDDQTLAVPDTTLQASVDTALDLQL